MILDWSKLRAYSASNSKLYVKLSYWTSEKLANKSQPFLKSKFLFSKTCILANVGANTVFFFSQIRSNFPNFNDFLKVERKTWTTAKFVVEVYKTYIIK